jgi:C4-dicarboxylate-specific signal transduction histidine kinase
VVNLVKNALEASGGQARPVLDVRIATVDDGARVLLEFADRGLGLPAGFDIGWFEPYRTSKAKGTGLGLAIVRKVVDEVGGEVSATNRDGGGAVFSVRLPRFA